MKRLLPIILVLLSFFGCVSAQMQPQWYHYHDRPKPPENVFINQQIVPIYLDTSFNAKELDAIGGAIKEWNTVFNGAVVLAISEKQVDHRNDEAVRQIQDEIETEYTGIYIVGATEKEDFVAEQGIQHGDGVLGWSDGIGDADRIVLLTDRMTYLPLKTLVLHEVGHAVGSVHFHVASLMWPYLGGNDQYNCVDLMTMLNVARFHHLDPQYMNYCRTPNEE